MLFAPKFDAKAVPPPASPTATIATAEQARHLLADVRRVLQRLGISLGSLHIAVEVANLREESHTVKALYPPPVRQRVDKIVLSAGMPALHAAQALAHEYMHAWLWLQGFPPLAPQLEEGLCELTAFLYLHSLQQEPEHTCLQAEAGIADLIAAELATIELDVKSYGAAFRDCISCLRIMSLHQLLGHVYSHSSLPSVRPLPSWRGLFSGDELELQDADVASGVLADGEGWHGVGVPTSTLGQLDVRLWTPPT